MAAKWVDLLRMRVSGSPTVTQAITRPNISFLPTPSGPLRIRDSGGQSPCIIFACDAPNVLEHYDAIFTLLSPSYRLIALEMPGFGFSYPAPIFDFSLQQYAKSTAFAIEKLQAGKVTLMFPCAWSYVAFHLATNRPELIDRLIVSQCPHWDEEQAWSRSVGMTSGVMGTPVLGQLFLALSPQRVSDLWYSNALPKGKPAEGFAAPARRVLADGGIFCLASLSQTWAQERNLAFDVEQPVVVMWGGADRTHRRSNPDSVLKYLQRGKIVTYLDAGHFPELEDPESLKDLLENEELWERLRITQTEQAAGSRTFVEEDTKLHESKTGVGNHNLSGDNQGRLKGRRKVPDSHL